MSDALPLPPLWFRAARGVVRRLPAGRFRAFRLLARIPIAPFVDRVQAENGSFAYRCDLRHLIAREICVTGRYAPAETALVRASLAAGGTFVDVGANIGYFALLGASIVGPTGRVVALEPDPRMAAALRENVAMNALGRIDVVETAASDVTGTATLTGYSVDGGNWGVSSLASTPPADAGAPSFTVTCAPLDSVLDVAGVDTVDLVKVDVEGAEPRVLRGMRDGLRARRYRRVLVELHPWEYADFSAELAAIMEEMAAFGYRGWLVDGSESDTRRSYYGRPVTPGIRPLVAGEVDPASWPHVLWTLPGLEPR